MSIQSPTGTAHQSQRVALFVDCQNMYHSANNLGVKLDYKTLKNKLNDGRNLIRARAYTATPPEQSDNSFLYALEKIGYETVVKDVKKFKDGNVKGDCDVHIALDAINIGQKVDTVILCSGDSDFRILVEQLQKKGTRVELAAFTESTANSMIQQADQFTPLNDSRFFFTPQGDQNVQ